MRKDFDRSNTLSELQLQNLLGLKKQDGLITLVDYIIEREFEYLVRPFYNRGSIWSELNKSYSRYLTEEELRDGAQTLC